MKILFTVVQWLVLLAWVYFFVYFGFHFKVKVPVVASMPGYFVLAISLSLAFLWVEVLKWGVTKPFNCVKCMSGWFSLLLAGCFHTPFWYFYLPLGLFVGAMWSAIKMRWL
jgi:hypothetical protein